MASAETHYVSPTGTASWPDATDIEQPCALTTALSNVGPGDIVYLRGGEYNTGIIINAKDGSSEAKITFQAYPGETPVIHNTTNFIFTGRHHALMIYYSDYIVIRGITFERVTGDYFFNISHDSNYNEIDSCIFNGNGSLGADGIHKGNIGLPDDDACTHNWIHHSTFYNIGVPNNNCSDDGGLKIGVWGSTPDNASGHTTFENNLLYNGGHHLLETYSKYNVIRNNIMHNEGWAEAVPLCTYGPSARSGMYGNRLLQIYDGSNSGNMYNLVEGNRLGHAAFASDGATDGNLVITSEGNIVRYNYSFYSETYGLYFKQGGNSNSSNNRVYNNTISDAGQDSMFYPDEWTGFGDNDLRIGIRVANGELSVDNVIKNNIIYNSHLMDIKCNASCEAGNTINNNWLTAQGDPLFVNNDVSEPTSLTLPDLRQQTGSETINAGTYLTQTTDSGTNSSTLEVDDALCFQDGTWGSALAGHVPDWIAVGAVDNTVQINSINYDTNTIELANAISWSDADPVWLYKKSDGQTILMGSAPDMGAHEYNSQATPTGTPPTISGIVDQEAVISTVFSLDLSEYVTEPDGDEITYTLDAGSDPLPDGLTLAANGTLSGTPTEACTRNIAIRVTDKDGQASENHTDTFELTVSEGSSNNGGGSSGSGSGCFIRTVIGSDL